MKYCKILTATFAIALCVAASAIAAKDADKSTKSHDGKFVSASGDHVVMTGKDGKEHTHIVDAKATITCDGSSCKAADLKAGMKIRVTTKAVAHKSATSVEALDEQAEFESLHEGTVVSFADEKLTMKDKEGKEHAHTLGKGAFVCCDGKTCKPTELKSGMKIRVTTMTSDEHVATRVEALGKNKRFAEIQEGTVVSLDDEQFVIADKDGKESTHILATDAALTRDGKSCKAADLKPETRVRVMISERAEDVIIEIEALDKHESFVLLDK